MRSWQSRGWHLSQPEAARPSPPSSLPSMAGLPGGTRAFPRWRERMPPLGGTVRISRPKPVSWRPLSRPKLIVLRARQPLPCTPWLSTRFKLRHSNRCMRVAVHSSCINPRTATDFALQATKVTVRSLGKVMSTMVVQEHHLWLNLAEIKDFDKARFLDAPISQAGLFSDTVKGFAQQFTAVQQQTEAIQHILPRCDAPNNAAPGSRPQSTRRRGRPPASSRAAPPQAESTSRPAHRASRRRAAPPTSQPGSKSYRKSTKRPWSRQPGDVGVCSFSGGSGGESCVSFCFCSAAGSRASGTHLLKERAISFSSRFSGPWDDSVRRLASSLSPTTHLASSQESAVRESSTSPRTSSQSRLGPREFGKDASERAAFCTIQPYSPSLHCHITVTQHTGRDWLNAETVESCEGVRCRPARSSADVCQRGAVR